MMLAKNSDNQIGEEGARDIGLGISKMINLTFITLELK